MVEGTMGGPGDYTYLHTVYAQSRSQPEDWVEPLPNWLLTLASGNCAQWPALLREARALDDWGLVADLARHRATSTRINNLYAAREGINEEIATHHERLDQIRWRLELATAADRLAFCERLAGPEGEGPPVRVALHNQKQQTRQPPPTTGGRRGGGRGRLAN